MKKLFLNKNTKDTTITLTGVIFVCLIVQLWMSFGSMSSLLKGLMVPLCVYTIMAVSLNLTVGILGELSLGHAGFMCVGAFTGAFFSKCTDGVLPDGIRFLCAILIGAVFATLFGFIIGIPVLRLKGDYLAIVTLAFCEIIKNIVNALYIGRDENGFHFTMKDSLSLGLSEQGEVIINGAQGISGTPNDSSFVIGAVLLVITLFIILNLVNSRSGRAIMAIRDNSIAAESVGLNLTKYKLMAFSISAGLAGVAGVLYAHNLSTLTALPKNFGYNMSINILVFVVLGGIGNIRGSIIATIILTLLPELLRGLNDYRMLMYAVVLIAVMLFNYSEKAKDFKEKLGFMTRKKFHAKEDK
ncbi:MAG: branched-chain amino acid ABC transporter permease [Lachnospiraceae bacterium]|nr:branched-chain amino acid ABC transporter permease [Lachnospiraceae bacterium]